MCPFEAPIRPYALVAEQISVSVSENYLPLVSFGTICSHPLTPPPPNSRQTRGSVDRTEMMLRRVITGTSMRARVYPTASARAIL